MFFVHVILTYKKSSYSTFTWFREFTPYANVYCVPAPPVVTKGFQDKNNRFFFSKSPRFGCEIEVDTGYQAFNYVKGFFFFFNVPNTYLKCDVKLLYFVL